MSLNSPVSYCGLQDPNLINPEPPTAGSGATPVTVIVPSHNQMVLPPSQSVPVPGTTFSKESTDTNIIDAVGH